MSRSLSPDEEMRDTWRFFDVDEGGDLPLFPVFQLRVIDFDRLYRHHQSGRIKSWTAKGWDYARAVGGDA